LQESGQGKQNNTISLKFCSWQFLNVIQANQRSTLDFDLTFFTFFLVLQELRKD